MEKILLMFLLVCLSSAVCASSQVESKKRGYWWGEAVELPTKEDEYPTPPPNPKTEDLMMMHPKELRELEEQYREYAIWKKTREATKDYWTVVDAARKQARAFTALTAVTMLENPQLNARSQNPITNAGRAAKRKQHDDSVTERLMSARKEFALVMFSQPGCTYCDVQRNTLKFFTDKHYWPFKEIDITKEPDIAQRFNINMTPITILIKKGTEKWMNIAVGVESVPNIEDNTYRAVRLMKGESTPQQFYTPEYMEGGFYDPKAGGNTE